MEKVNQKNKTANKKKDIEKIKITKNQNDPKRFVKEIRTTDSGEVAGNIQYLVDKEIFDNEEKFNGLYGITTNLINDTKTIVKIIKNKW